MKNPNKCLDHYEVRKLALKHGFKLKEADDLKQYVYDFADELQTIAHPNIVFGYGRVGIANTLPCELPKIILTDDGRGTVGEIYEQNYPDSKPPLENILCGLCFHNLAGIDALLDELNKLRSNMLAGKYDLSLIENGIPPIEDE